MIQQESPDTNHVAQTEQTMTGSRNLGLDPGAERPPTPQQSPMTHAPMLEGAKFEPMPAPVPRAARQRPKMIPDSFVIFVVERK